MNEAPLSLYIQLEEGKVADLEVVASAALAWDALIKEVAYVIDPSLEVRVELVSGTEGSLRLNNLIKAYSKAQRKYKKTFGITYAIIAFFVSAPLLHLQDHIGDDVWKLLGHEDGAEFSEEEKREILEGIRIILRENVARQQKQNLFRELERDPSITGVGATPDRESKPKVIVPRSEFLRRAGGDAVTEETVHKRTRQILNYPVILIRPVLKDGEYMWRFEQGGEEFSASMKDETFRDALAEDKTGLHFRIGEEMIIDIEIKEERSGEVW
jgi:hypothetical protein